MASSTNGASPRRLDRVIHICNRVVEALVRDGEWLAVQAKSLVPKVIVRCAGEMAEVAIESEIRRLLAEMPLARHRSEISRRLQHLRDRHRALHPNIAGLLAPASREQAHARRVALRRVIELRKAHSIRGELVHIWCCDLAAVTS